MGSVHKGQGPVEREVEFERRYKGRRNSNKVKVSVWVDPDQLESLRDLSDATMIPQTAIIRHGIDLAIEKIRSNGGTP